MTIRYVSFNAIFMLLNAEYKTLTQYKEAKEQIKNSSTKSHAHQKNSSSIPPSNDNVTRQNQ